MPRSQSFQELSAKLSSDELVKRLKVSCRGLFVF